MNESLPSRERGLKSSILDTENASSLSLPSRERGLKSVYNKLYESSLLVAPFAGAWIEILMKSLHTRRICRRSLRGSVD